MTAWLGAASLSWAAAESREGFECRWTDGDIAIDGKADEASWQNAQPIENFSMPWLSEGRRPKAATAARLLWDRQYLYFFARMEDRDVRAAGQEQDGEAWTGDALALFLKPAVDWPGYYEFQVNAAGAVRERFLPQRSDDGKRPFQDDAALHVEARVVRNAALNEQRDKDSGWTVEGRIPWITLLAAGGRPDAGETWRFAICRSDAASDSQAPELSTNAPLRSSDFHRHEDYAELRFTGPGAQDRVKAPWTDEYGPVTTSRVAGSPEAPPPWRARRIYPQLKLTHPIDVIREPGGRRLWFIDQKTPYGPARVARTGDDPATGEHETLVAFEDGVAYDIAFHPGFAGNGYVFIGLNSGPPGEKQTRVVRYTVGRQPPYRFDADSATEIIHWPSDGHNGGAIAFGTDGMLYVTSGDGTSDSDTLVVGQDLTKLTSKVLRIDVDHPADGQAYAVPGDNPFIGVDGVRPETWAYGFRNPWRIAVDPQTGDVWVGNNGQDLWEQAYRVERGANYGWSVYEGSHPFYLNRELGPTPVSPPTVEHHHSEFRSLTGGVVYHGTKLPEARGAYIYGDHSTGKIWGVRHDGTRIVWHQELADSTLQITAIAVDADGELLIADHQGNSNGGFYTLEPNPDDGTHAAFPRRLSESGLFRSVKDHRLVPGAIPYSVNAPLWSDGATKERYIVLPATIENGREVPARIDFTAKDGWNFPDRTVLVKSFALEMVEGDTESRRWIETRFLTKQQGEWAGYSYQWTEDQTDAVLVDRRGLDRDFTLHTAAGPRRQTWHYPGRTECMVCHSRAANFVLGPSLLQMNKDHDYGGRVRNQLRVLEGLGVLRVNWESEAHPALRRHLKSQMLSDEEVERRFTEMTATRGQRSAVPSSFLFKPPAEHDRLVDPYDEKQPLQQRARSYLHANCAQCHVEAGGGNAQINLSFSTPRDGMGVIGAAPLHDAFGMAEARLIAPGAPQRSVLLHRLSIRGRGQMPQLASSVVDQKAVDLIRRWIEKMDEAPQP